MSNIDDLVVKTYDDKIVSADDKNSVRLNFPMWLGESLINEINEINERNITVVVIKDYDGNNHIHLTDADENIITRVQKAFWGYPKH